MQKELIYEKRYQKENIAELLAAAKADGDQDSEAAPEFKSVEAFLEWAYKGVEYRYLPERKKTAKAFIKTAMETSELFEIDTNIWRYKDHIMVEYCFDCAGAMGFLKDTLVYADNIVFFKDVDGHDIIMQIDHYTHAVYRNGRRRRP